jgi:OmcA/MtrC family decaheme c-type cytochrome
VVSNEACIICHGQNADFQIANVHEFDPVTGVQNTLGTATITITSVTFGAPAGDNVPVTIDFTFNAVSAAGVNITSQIDLRTVVPSTPPSVNDNLAFVSFLLAKLTPGTNGGSNEWSGFVVTPGASGSSPFRANRQNGAAGAVFTGTPATGQYSYTFPTSAVRVSDGYVDNVVVRAGVQFSIGGPFNTASGAISSENAVNSPILDLFSTDLKLQNTSDRRPVANATLDVVPPVGGGVGTAPTAAYPTKNDVTTAACNKCHDVLAIHGGGRRETQFCVICHNPKLETAGVGYTSEVSSSLLNVAHKIHTGQNPGAFGGNDNEVAYPQAAHNCLTCHKGTDDFWKSRPTRYACGSCHINVNFATGAGHIGGAQANDQTCSLCHPTAQIPVYHANKDGAPPTPDNPVLAGTLSYFQYGIDTVTVDNTNAATVTFWVKKDGVFVNFLPSPTDNVAVRPAGFTGGPSFLIAHSGAAANPQDYTNWDEVATTGFGQPFATGQPKSVTLIGLPITATDNTNTKFRARLTGTNSFPAGAKMRAVALQGYFTQTSGGVGLDNVGRHTPAVMKNVTGDATRRVIVKSGYVDNTGALVDDTNPAIVGNLTPIGCLECHEAFEGHGGNRVNNVQVCVMCHNPQLTTSARTIPDNVTINPTIVSKLGSNPLNYPEVAQNMGEMIHGLHAGLGTDPQAVSTTAAGLRQQNVRVNNFQIVRNRQESPGVYGVYIDSAEVTYPGDLTHCTKCHFSNNPGAGNTPQSYKADLPTGVLFTTEKVTTGNAGETLAQIIGARQSFQGHDPSGNPTDLVSSPIARKCGSCHDGPAEVGHFLSTGGADIKNTRSIAELTPPTLAPASLPAP